MTSMGFATNSTTLPALLEKGCLLVSDEFNHSSLVFGARLSRATIRTFKHNGPCPSVVSLSNGRCNGSGTDLAAGGDPWSTHLPSAVEEDPHCCGGLVQHGGQHCPAARGGGPQEEVQGSAESYLANLIPEQCYLYVDEAHSIGALGKHGRGVCDYRDVSPADVDILMGTFTKSFGAAGGYIAASKVRH